MADTTPLVRERAYLLWESAGHPDGREDEFWSEAEREIEAEQLVIDQIAVGKPVSPESKSVKAKKPKVAKGTADETAP